MAKTTKTTTAKTAKTTKTAKKSNGAVASSAAKKAKEDQKPNLPMFYNEVVPLTAAAHGNLKVKSQANNVTFAKSANSVMLTAVEFSQAAQSFPVVFGSEELESLPFAVTGHTGGQNAFVDEKGNWREGVYIPAYVRRYPFILIENKQNKSFSLAVDPTSGLLSEDEGNTLYENGEATEIAQNILNLCFAYQQEFMKTKEVCVQINETGILIDRAADVTLPDGSKTRVSGFRVVDEKAFNALDDKTFLALRKTGALTLIYCHLWSMRTWNNLLG